MGSVHELAAINGFPIELLPVADAPVTERTLLEYETKINLGDLRLRYNPDRTVTFMHTTDHMGSSAPIRYTPIDLETGWTAQGNRFGKQLPPDLTTLLRLKTAQLNETMAQDPRPNKLITDDIRQLYLKARTAGKIRIGKEDEEPVISWRRKIPLYGDRGTEFREEYADVDMARGIIKPSESHRGERALHQGWWELMQEEVSMSQQLRSVEPIQLFPGEDSRATHTA